MCLEIFGIFLNRKFYVSLFKKNYNIFKMPLLYTLCFSLQVSLLSDKSRIKDSTELKLSDSQSLNVAQGENGKLMTSCRLIRAGFNLVPLRPVIVVRKLSGYAKLCLYDSKSQAMMGKKLMSNLSSFDFAVGSESLHIETAFSYSVHMRT